MAKAAAAPEANQESQDAQEAPPADEAPAKVRKTRQPRQAPVQSDGSASMTPKQRLRELEAQAKQLIRDEAVAISGVTAEFRTKRNDLAREHAEVSKQALFG